MNDRGNGMDYFEKISGAGVQPRHLGAYATKAALDAEWPASSLGVGMTGSTATIAGVPSIYYPVVGWVAQSASIPPTYESYASLPSIARNGDIAYIPQLVGTELVRMRYVAAISAWTVEPGQCLINAVDIFTVASAPSTADIVYSFPYAVGLIRARQMWRIDAWATGTIAGATAGGFRTRFGGVTTNSTKTMLSLINTTYKARHNKTISIRADGKVDCMEFDGAQSIMIGEDPLIPGNYIPEFVFNPFAAGDSITLKHYTLRRIG